MLLMEIFDDQNYKMHIKMIIPLMRFTVLICEWNIYYDLKDVCNVFE
jgi:hypothetical protein